MAPPAAGRAMGRGERRPLEVEFRVHPHRLRLVEGPPLEVLGPEPRPAAVGQDQPIGRHDLGRPVRARPLQPGGRAPAALVVLDLQVDRPSRDEIDRGVVLRRGVVAPVLDQELSVEPQPHAVVRDGRQPVAAARRRGQPARPAGREVPFADRRVNVDGVLPSLLHERLHGEARGGLDDRALRLHPHEVEGVDEVLEHPHLLPERQAPSPRGRVVEERAVGVGRGEGVVEVVEEPAPREQEGPNGRR